MTTNLFRSNLNIGIFTSASSKLHESYYNLARELGTHIAQAGHNIIYGGANIGLMGAIADAALKHNGQVIGVFPENLGSREIAHPGLNELILTEGLHERKKIMYDRSDFFITLPGGFGTLDETFEVLTWNQLGHIQKPLYLFNHENFFEHLLLFIKKLEEEKFIKVYDSVGIRSIQSMKDFHLILEKELQKKYGP
jgi:uncharacterized protein (TIGR00730 family)